MEGFFPVPIIVNVINNAASGVTYTLTYQGYSAATVTIVGGSICIVDTAMMQQIGAPEALYSTDSASMTQ